MQHNGNISSASCIQSIKVLFPGDSYATWPILCTKACKDELSPSSQSTNGNPQEWVCGSKPRIIRSLQMAN